MNQSQFQKAAGLSAELAARWFQPVSDAMKEFGITKPVRSQKRSVVLRN